MSGGQGPGEEIPEAVAMAKYAEEKGIFKQDIIVEDKSKTTRENLVFSHRLMKSNSRFAIVTNSYHVYRALVLAKEIRARVYRLWCKTKVVLHFKCFCTGIYCLLNDYLAFAVECCGMYWIRSCRIGNIEVGYRMNKLKIIAIDVDGTLLNSKKQLTRGVKNAILMARKAGIKIVIATGRPLSGVEEDSD